MKIHGIAYLVIGLFVTLVSSFVENMKIFIVFGIIFMAIGVGKLIFMKTAEEVKEERQERVAQPKYIRCPSCHAFNYPYALRCHFCHKRIK